MEANTPYPPYQNLLAKIDAFSHSTQKKRPEAFSCREGCFGCCEVHLSVVQVEAGHLQRATEALPEEVFVQVEQNARALLLQNEERCPFLLEGRCAVYEHRPVICRSHGLPVTWADLRARAESYDVCPLNFQGMTPTSKEILDVDTINAILFTVDSLFCKETQQKQERMSMAEVILSAKRA